jgi:YidC/Oxa1 family membrane protein insertase
MFDKTKINYILFFVLSLAIIVGYSIFFAPKSTHKATQVVREEKTVEEQQPSPVKEKMPAEGYVIPKEPKGELITIKTPLYTGTIDTAGGRIISWNLEKYRETTSKDSPTVNLFKDSPPSYNFNLKLKGFKIPDIIPFKYDGNKVLDLHDGKHDLTLYWKSPEGIEVRNILTINPNSYLLGQRFEVTNPKDFNIDQRLSVEWYDQIQHKGRNRNNKDFIALVSDNVKHIDKLPAEPTQLEGLISWFGFSNKYFLKAYLTEIGGETQIIFSSAGSDSLARAVYRYPEDTIPGGTTSIHKSRLFLGPKEYQILKSSGFELQNAINYGWAGIIARPVGQLLTYINTYIHNYGISIIVITVIMRLIFLPLTVKSMASMKEMQNKMQQIKPKIDALKEKYKDDKTKQNTELMKLYSSYGINPLSSLGGCLPLLIQLPVFIALYEVLLYSIELRQSSFLWVKDLSEPETLFTIPEIGIPFRILPLLMGASWYLSQKMTPTTTVGTDNMQMKLMQFMPLIFTVMFWGLPSGLILYWTVSNILSIGQQLYVNSRSRVPKGGNVNAGSDRKRSKDRVRSHTKSM